ncbi:histidine biosynthesis trifunctional-protein [Fomitiporia mediterranea MF3/22]|uniref:histidine biosynthesis trifunctional-protein n=1 Tax=Fomitiporia mediterranea (strain MF3/22) TaxID=694068 RepID=UPI000440748B|nr:histidine biosynthesis trifunctional-protein [Fomitiporia mediterranea MF3/22]EJD01107.1 histidine biosynthesis trifunctional-protein [Fomitiporia mediterranea MF3/22]
MSAFLALIDNADASLIWPLSRIAPLILTADAASQNTLPANASYFVLAEHDSSANLDDVVSWLDNGADKVILPLSWAIELAGVLPPERLVLLLDVANVSAVSDKLRAGVSGVLVRTPAADAEFVSSISRFFTGSDIYVQSTASSPPSLQTIRQLKNANATLVLPTSQLSITDTSSSHLNIADAFLAPISTDRPDGLIPTVVSSFNQGGRSLGLVYSSIESIKESILTGRGVYQSRKHGLWRKGETSGSTQDVVKISLDCDSDSLEFSVIQHGKGFCHLDRPSCFGRLSGLSALEQTLQSRLESAPEGSYTRRLFNDPDLLRSKIMEEADELSTAETKDQVAFEAADLIYFALTRCVAAGVSIADIEHNLDKKSKKVTRRPGNAKPQWSSKPQNNNSTTQDGEKANSSSPAPLSPDEPIRMRTTSLDGISATARAELLKRPVLRSDEMIAKVKPIVDAVRTRGDAALLDFTAKFDKATLSSPILRPPFSKESMALPTEVRAAIDIAYANIRMFHAAQTSDAPLVVETSPGVVCTRFARPIARVGLYVPGGTAILPSTALMLGAPAQVAGCHEIVLATPPRPDGSISPEVMYVAQLVGASAILIAGGAQAVAALAYGTESVPKVDKIFGPGNQWVTAAKMLVQNDTDALVSIDMPAGPSEVLVIADHTANASFVAADLLSQAEHGIDSQVVLVAINLPTSHISEIEYELDKQARALPRVDIMRESIPKSLIVNAKSFDEAIQFSNDYAPEHLILHIEQAAEAVKKVNNAGSVFVGPYTPESCGDYASGTNHTLPTNGYARQFSGVNTQSFQKHITSQEITREGLEILGPVVATLADTEGLGAHANAVRLRLQAGA